MSRTARRADRAASVPPSLLAGLRRGQGLPLPARPWPCPGPQLLEAVAHLKAAGPRPEARAAPQAGQP